MWIVYFSQSCQVEEQFENKFKSKIDIDFDGTIGHFLGINFKCTWSKDGKAQVHLSQPAFIENLLHEENLDGPAVTPANTLYKSSLPVDKIPALTLAPLDQAPLTKKMQHLIGSLTWLSISTRPDVATITNMLAKYSAKPSQAHIDHVRYVLCYLKSHKRLDSTSHIKAIHCSNPM